MGDQFNIAVKDVDGGRTREIVDYFEHHGCIIDKFYWSPNPTMDGKGTLTIVYHAPDLTPYEDGELDPDEIVYPDDDYSEGEFE